MILLETILALVVGYAALYGVALTVREGRGAGVAPFGIAAVAVGFICAYQVTGTWK